MPDNSKGSDFEFALPVGYILAGRFAIVECVASGRLSFVYKALDNSTGDFVAVKEYFPLGWVERKLKTNSSSVNSRNDSLTLDSLINSSPSNYKNIIRSSPKQYQHIVRYYKSRSSMSDDKLKLYAELKDQRKYTPEINELFDSIYCVLSPVLDALKTLHQKSHTGIFNLGIFFSPLKVKAF